MAKTKGRRKTRSRDTSIAKLKLGKYETKWVDVHGVMPDSKVVKLFSTKTMVKNILPGITIMGLGQVRYALEGEESNDKKSE